MKEVSDAVKRRYEASGMPCGLECPDGWIDLVNELEAELAKTDPDHIIDQVKEKFGGLRYYTGPLTDAGHDLIDEYERRSQNTCQVCGEPGDLTSLKGRWMATLCDTHHKQQEERMR